MSGWRPPISSSTSSPISIAKLPTTQSFALYPEDLGPAEVRLRMFFEQYWGGPTTYSDERGHPRLRLRHGPFAIDEQARDLWLAHMRTALDNHPIFRQTLMTKCGATS